MGKHTCLRFVRCLLRRGAVEALAFAIDRTSHRFADLSTAEAAAIIASGKGVLGTNLEYFDHLAGHVAVLGIEDEVFEAIRSQLLRT